MTPEMSHAVSGVFCAAATPLLADDAPDHASLAEHCKALLEEGCDGIALLGTTGEANSFGIGERKTILERLLAAGVPAGVLLPGTGHTSVPDTIELTRHAVEAGVRGVVMLPPFYYKGVSDEGLFRAYARVIEGVGRDQLKVVLYHIPPTANVPISHALIARLREAFPGIVVGIKDSSGSLESMTGTAQAFPGFSVLSGADPFMLPLLRAGGAGCITSSSNLIAADLRIVFDNWNDPAKGDAVEAAQARIEAWRNLTNAYVQLPTVKAMLARRRNNGGWMRVRPPLIELDDAQRDDVWAQMARLESL
jgi:4-hydroxy-tetrahydrodipicolinate synthase